MPAAETPVFSRTNSIPVVLPDFSPSLMWYCRTSVFCLQYVKQISSDKTLLILKLYFSQFSLLWINWRCSNCVSLNILLLVLIFLTVWYLKLETVLQLRPYSPSWAEDTNCYVQEQQIFFPLSLQLSNIGPFRPVSVFQKTISALSSVHSSKLWSFSISGFHVH